MGSLTAIVALVSDSSYALIAGTAGGLLRRSSVFPRIQRLVSGGVYLGLGATTALTGSRD